MKIPYKTFTKQIMPFIDESMKKNIEITAQLCKVNDEIRLGKKFYGTESGVKFNWGEMKKCDEGEFVGTIHNETLPHFPPFPSDVDIEASINSITKQIHTKPFLECVCSAGLKGTLEKGMLKMGCYCENWKPWTKEENEKIIEKTKDIPMMMGFGMWVVRDRLRKMGYIHNPQLIWGEFKLKNKGFAEKTGDIKESDEWQGPVITDEQTAGKEKKMMRFPE